MSIGLSYHMTLNIQFRICSQYDSLCFVVILITHCFFVEWCDLIYDISIKYVCLALFILVTEDFLVNSRECLLDLFVLDATEFLINTCALLFPIAWNYIIPRIWSAVACVFVLHTSTFLRDLTSPVPCSFSILEIIHYMLFTSSIPIV